MTIPPSGAGLDPFGRLCIRDPYAIIIYVITIDPCIFRHGAVGITIIPCIAYLCPSGFHAYFKCASDTAGIISFACDRHGSCSRLYIVTIGYGVICTRQYTSTQFYSHSWCFCCSIIDKRIIRQCDISIFKFKFLHVLFCYCKIYNRLCMFRRCFLICSFGISSHFLSLLQFFHCIFESFVLSIYIGNMLIQICIPFLCDRCFHCRFQGDSFHFFTFCQCGFISIFLFCNCFFLFTLQSFGFI